MEARGYTFSVWAFIVLYNQFDYLCPFVFNDLVEAFIQKKTKTNKKNPQKPKWFELARQALIVKCGSFTVPGFELTTSL